MTTEQVNITLGTAGHIDHGKTVLIRLLTGCDTDRLKAEKERGMSIELGFAPCKVADLEVGVVDVPGHENFVKTMVAGASGMDGVILVVAADDGVMPQTREHLDILTLLGIRHGIVALTKIDRVEPEQVEIASAEVRDFLEGTFLEDASILPISGVTGEGYEPFYEGLATLVRSIEPKRTEGLFRLPVERAFSLAGYGTVVSGIPVSGQVRLGDEVVLLPRGIIGRIRGIQVYQRDSNAAKAGQCAALNVPQWDHRMIERGNAVTVPGYFSPRVWYLCRLRLLPVERLFLKSGAQVKFHTGTSEVLAKVYPVEGSRVEAGQECLVQVRSGVPLVAAPRDRFIVRSLSPVETIGGGMVLEAIPGRLKRGRVKLRDDLEEQANAVLDDRDFVEYCVRRADSVAASPSEIALRAKLPGDLLQPILAELVREEKVVSLGPDLYVHRRTAAEVGERLLGIVADFHRRSPQSPGITLEQLREASGLQQAVLERLTGLLKKEDKLTESKHRLALPEHREEASEKELQAREKVEALFRDRAFHPPGFQEVIQVAGITSPEADRLLKLLVEHEALVQVADDLLFHREAVERARKILASFIQKEGKLESVKFKYLLDTTRKFAIPLLDYFDRIGVTVRVGNTRYLKSSGQAAPDSQEDK